MSFTRDVEKNSFYYAYDADVNYYKIQLNMMSFGSKTQ